MSTFRTRFAHYKKKIGTIKMSVNNGFFYNIHVHMEGRTSPLQVSEIILVSNKTRDSLHRNYHKVESTLAGHFYYIVYKSHHLLL